jgi:hypothetical protein
MELTIIAEAKIVDTGVGPVKQAKTDELGRGVEHRSYSPIYQKLIPSHPHVGTGVIERTISIKNLVLNDQRDVIRPILIRQSQFALGVFDENESGKTMVYMLSRLVHQVGVIPKGGLFIQN